jgi:hypothetical protein
VEHVSERDRAFAPPFVRLSPLRFPSADLDDLARGMPLPDMGESGGDVIEPVRPVDPDVDVPSHTEVGQRGELGGALPHGEDAQPATGEPPASEPAVNTRSPGLSRA